MERGPRSTLAEMNGILRGAGLETPIATEMLFSMLECLDSADQQAPWTDICLLYRVRALWHPTTTSKPGDLAPLTTRCTLDLDHCFGVFWTKGEPAAASEVFKRVTFERPECGDCRECHSVDWPICSCAVIMALVTASGPLGLSAFMPDAKTVFQNKATNIPKHRTPLLPITDTWQAADFTLQAVIQDTVLPGVSVDLRRYTSQLLARYLYTSGESNV